MVWDPHENENLFPPRKRGRPKKHPDKKMRRVDFCVTPWIYKAMEAIREKEGMTISRVVRGLLLLGIARYRELGKLPEMDE